MDYCVVIGYLCCRAVVFTREAEERDEAVDGEGLALGVTATAPEASGKESSPGEGGQKSPGNVVLMMCGMHGSLSKRISGMKCSSVLFLWMPCIILVFIAQHNCLRVFRTVQLQGACVWSVRSGSKLLRQSTFRRIPCTFVRDFGHLPK